jgi:ribosomal protein S20
MPITKSAQKAMRSAAKKRVSNLRLNKNIRDAVKGLKKTIKENGDIKKDLATAQKAIDKALKKNFITRNKAARKKSQMAKFASGKTKIA